MLNPNEYTFRWVRAYSGGHVTHSTCVFFWFGPLAKGVNEIQHFHLSPLFHLPVVVYTYFFLLCTRNVHVQIKSIFFCCLECGAREYVCYRHNGPYNTSMLSVSHTHTHSLEQKGFPVTWATSTISPLLFSLLLFFLPVSVLLFILWHCRCLRLHF